MEHEKKLSKKTVAYVGVAAIILLVCAFSFGCFKLKSQCGRNPLPQKVEVRGIQ